MPLVHRAHPRKTLAGTPGQCLHALLSTTLLFAQARNGSLRSGESSRADRQILKRLSLMSSMRTVPQPGEVWFIDLGLVGKPRYALVLAAQTDARLALASVVLITKQFEGITDLHLA